MQSPTRQAKSHQAEQGATLPMAVKLAMVLSLVLGAAVTLRWSWDPPKFVLVRPFQAVAALRPRSLAAPGFSPGGGRFTMKTAAALAQNGSPQAQAMPKTRTAGWPMCIDATRDIIEEMAAADQQQKGWHSTRSVIANRRFLQETSGGEGDGDSAPQDSSSTGEAGEGSGRGSSDDQEAGVAAREGDGQERDTGSSGDSSSDGGAAAQAVADNGGGGASQGGETPGGGADAPTPASEGSHPEQDGDTASAAGASTEPAAVPAPKAKKKPKRKPKFTKKQTKPMPTFDRSKRVGKTKRSSLLAVPTANVWEKTELLLQSLTANSDVFELLVVDELSSDETPQRLQNYTIWHMTPPERLGVTYNWNMAYRAWLDTDHEFLFYVNNDVLVPDGVVDALARAMTPEGGDCDLVTPQSTVKGKGYWGSVEGLELQLNLSDAGHDFVSSPLNYRRVQAAFTEAGCLDKSAVREEKDVHQKIPGFSGFFFGVRRGITQWAWNEDHLFNPGNRLFAQEQDLFGRSQKAEKKAKICMHTGTFVYHFKGSTLPIDPNKRANWHMPGSEPAPKQQRKAPKKKGKAKAKATPAAAEETQQQQDGQGAAVRR